MVTRTASSSDNSGSSSSQEFSDSPLAQAQSLLEQGHLDEALGLVQPFQSKSMAARAMVTRIQNSQQQALSPYCLGLLEAFAGGNPAEASPYLASLKNLGSNLADKKSLKLAFESLSESDQAEIRNKAGASFEEIISLSQETNPEMFWEQSLHFSKGLLSDGKTEASASVLNLIHESLGEGKEYSNSDISKRASEQLQAIQGQGSIGLRFEFLASHFLQDMMDYKTVLPMMASGVASELTQTFFLGRWANLTQKAWYQVGMGARVSSGLLAFGMETTTFSLMGRGLRQLSGEEVSWDAKSVGTDLFESTLSLGVLKICGFLGNQGFLKLHGLSELGAPTRLSGLAKFTQVALPQVSTFAGMMASHKLEEGLGLRKPVDGATTVTDTLVSMFNLGVGGHLGHTVMGESFAAFQKELGARDNIYSDFSKESGKFQSKAEVTQSAKRRASLSLAQSPLLAPMWMMLGAGGIGGFGAGEKKRITEAKDTEEFPEEDLPAPPVPKPAEIKPDAAIVKAASTDLENTRAPSSIPNVFFLGFPLLIGSIQGINFRSFMRDVLQRCMHGWLLFTGRTSHHDFESWRVAKDKAAKLQTLRENRRETNRTFHARWVRRQIDSANKREIDPLVWMSRALKNASPGLVESSLDILFADSFGTSAENTEQKISFIREHSLSDGASFLQDVFDTNFETEQLDQLLQNCEAGTVQSWRYIREIDEQLKLAEDLLRFGKPEGALPFVERVAKISSLPQSVEANRILLKVGKVESAKENLHAAIELDENHSIDAAELMGEVQRAHKENTLPEAIQATAYLIDKMRAGSEDAARVLAKNELQEAVDFLLATLPAKVEAISTPPTPHRGAHAKLISILGDYLHANKESDLSRTIEALEKSHGINVVATLDRLFETNLPGSFVWRRAAQARLELGASGDLVTQLIPWIDAHLRQPNAAAKISRHAKESEGSPKGMANPELRKAAIRFAAKLGWEGAIPHLEAILKNDLEEEEVQLAASEALFELGRADLAEAALRADLQYPDRARQAAALLDRVAPGWSDFISEHSRKKALPARGYRHAPTEHFAEVQDQEGNSFRLYYEGQEPKGEEEEDTGSHYRIYTSGRGEEWHEEKWLGLVTTKQGAASEELEFTLIPDKDSKPPVRILLTTQEALKKNILSLSPDGTLQLNPDLSRLYAKKLRPSATSVPPSLEIRISAKKTLGEENPNFDEPQSDQEDHASLKEIERERLAQLEADQENETEPKTMAKASESDGGKLFSFGSPALLGLDLLMNGHPTLPGILITGMATLASSGTVLGVFSKIGKRIGRWLEKPDKTNPTDSVVNSKGRQAESVYRKNESQNEAQEIAPLPWPTMPRPVDPKIAKIIVEWFDDFVWGTTRFMPTKEESAREDAWEAWSRERLGPSGREGNSHNVALLQESLAKAMIDPKMSEELNKILHFEFSTEQREKFIQSKWEPYLHRGDFAGILNELKDQVRRGDIRHLIAIFQIALLVDHLQHLPHIDDPHAGGKLHSFGAPALFGIDMLMNGHPTLPGMLVAGIATLVSSGALLGTFQRKSKRANEARPKNKSLEKKIPEIEKIKNAFNHQDPKIQIGARKDLVNSLPGLDPSDRIDLALHLVRYLGLENAELRKQTLSTVNDIYLQLQEKERERFVAEIKNRLIPIIAGIDGMEDSIIALQGLLPILPVDQRFGAVLKMIPFARVDRKNVGPIAIDALRQSTFHLNAEENLHLAQFLDNRSSGEKWNRKFVKERLFPHLPKKEHKLALSSQYLEEDQFELSEGQKMGALLALCGVIPHLSTSDHLPFILKVLQKPKGELSREYINYAVPISLFLNAIVPILNPQERLRVAMTLLSNLNTPDEFVRSIELTRAQIIIPLLEPKEALSFFSELFVSSHEDEDNRAFLFLLNSFTISTKLAFLEKSIRDHGLDSLPLKRLAPILDDLPRRALEKFALSRKDPGLLALSQFSSTLLPYDLPGLWEEFLAAPDRETWIQELGAQLQPYRRGADIDFNDPAQLRLAYLSMDRPSELGWDSFCKIMAESNGQKLPPPFLKGEFSFDTHRQSMIHETIDKGVMKREIESVTAAEDFENFQEGMVELFSHPPRPLRQDLRKFLIEKFGFESDADFSSAVNLDRLKGLLADEDHFSQIMKRVLPLLAAQAHRSQELAQKFADAVIFLASDREGSTQTMLDILDYQNSLQNPQPVSSATMLKTLKALLFLYQDLAKETVQELNLPLPKILQDRERTLAQQLKNISMQKLEKARVELLFGKSRTDQFFGFIGEDCNKGKEEEIFKPNFQVARLLVDGILEGMVYIHADTHQRKRALTLALGIRERLNVDHSEILKGVETIMSQLAMQGGYNYVLIPEETHEQGNRSDTVQAIEERKYPKVAFSNTNSELFSSENYFLVWERPKLPPSPQDMDFLAAQLKNLAGSRSLIPESKRASVQDDLQRAAAGEISVVEAAEALVDGIKHGNILQLQKGIFDEEKGKRIAILKDVKHYRLSEMENPPPLVQRFLAAHPGYQGEVSELSYRNGIPTIKNSGRFISSNDLMGSNYLSVNQELYEGVLLKYKGIERHYPLAFLLWAERERNGDQGVKLQFTSKISSLDELRDLLEKDTRPFVILAKSPEDQGEDMHGPYFLHDAPHNELKSVYHENYHQYRWNQHGPVMRLKIAKEMIQLYDGLKLTLSRIDPNLLVMHDVHEALDELLSGPPSGYNMEELYGRPFWYLNYHLSKNLGSDVRQKIAQAFYHQVQEDFRENPNLQDILFWLREKFPGCVSSQP